jgi:hypothetical protein
MPTLTDKNQIFALQLSAASAITWTLQQQQTVATPQQVGSSTNPQNLDFEGIASALGNTDIGAPGIPGFTLEATYISLVNTDPSVTQTVSYGKVILPHTYFQVSPTFVLAPGESAIFVKDAGWATYDANGSPKTEGATSGLLFSDGTTQETAAPATAATYCAVANISNAQSIPNAAYTPITFDTVTYDPDNQFSGGTTFTAKQPGIYSIQGSVRIAADGASGYGMVTIYHNGNPCGGDSHPALSGQVSSLSVGMDLVLAAGDTIQLAYYQNSGGAVSTAVSHTNVVQFTAMTIALLANSA